MIHIDRETSARKGPEAGYAAQLIGIYVEITLQNLRAKTLTWECILYHVQRCAFWFCVFIMFINLWFVWNTFCFEWSDAIHDKCVLNQCGLNFKSSKVLIIIYTYLSASTLFFFTLNFLPTADLFFFSSAKIELNWTWLKTDKQGLSKVSNGQWNIFHVHVHIMPVLSWILIEWSVRISAS